MAFGSAPLRQLRILLWRDFWPAPMDSGWRGFISYRMVIAVLPIAGLCTFLAAVIVTLLIITALEKNLERREQQIRGSSFQSIFAEGTFFAGGDPGPNVPEHFQLEYWQQLPWNSVFGGSKHHQLFAAVYPFDWADLHIVGGDGEERPYQRGMALAFSGPHADQRLLAEIAVLSGMNKTPIKPSSGLILSRDTLTAWKFGEVPSHLWIRHPYGREYVPVPVIGIAERLPHRLPFVMPLTQWQRFKSHFYDREISRFGITQPFKQRQPQKIFPTTTTTGPAYLNDAGFHIRYSLPHPLSRAAIAGLFLKAKMKGNLDLGPHEPPDQVVYTGALFQSSSQLLATRDSRPLYGLERFFSSKTIAVQGSFIPMLIQHVKDRHYFKNLRWAAAFLLFILTGLQMLFITLMLHTRLHRIGVLRMLGISDRGLALLYGLQGCLLWLTAFGACLLVFAVWRPFGLELSWQTLHLTEIALSCGLTVVSFSLPAICFTRLLTPGEMMAYR